MTKSGIFSDHWAFLEHFDAPMWADLTLQSNSAYDDDDDDGDDDWFHQNHLFHQLSARRLKSKFAHSLDGFASPGLPSSVSKSRGKHYNNNTNWGKGVNLNALLDKHQGLSTRGRFKQGVTNPKSALTFEHNAKGKTVATSSSIDKKNYEKGNTSSVRSNSFGKSVVTQASRVQKSGSSSVNSISLRKSYVTKKASKVEMDVDNMKSRGRNSSSGKSSVGSCSNPSYQVKFVSKEPRKKISNTKDVVTLNLADKNRSNLGNKFKTSSVTAQGKGKGSIIGNNISAAKSLIKTQSVCSSTKLPGKVNKTNICPAAKETLPKGKENATRKLTVNKHCNEKGVLTRGVLKSPKTRQHKDDKAGSAALTVLGKVNGEGEAKKPVNPARRIYLR